MMMSEQEQVVGVEESNFYYYQPSDPGYTSWGMTVYGHRVDYRLFAKTKEEAESKAKEKFAEIIGQVIKVEGQLSRMEYDEEEY